jgi:hypothetical protein
MLKRNYPPRNGLHQLVADIYAPQTAVLSCSQAERLIALVADNLLDDDAAQSQYPDLFSHLQTCEDCTAIYEMVMEYAHLEASDELPNPTFIPSMPAELHSASKGWVGELLRILFPGFAPVQPTLALRGRSDLPPVTVALGDEGLQIELQVQPSTVSPELRTLLCTLTTPDVPDIAAVATISLERAMTGEVEQTQTSELPADVVFLDIPPDQYWLRIEVNGQTFLIERLEVP